MVEAGIESFLPQFTFGPLLLCGAHKFLLDCHLEERERFNYSHLGPVWYRFYMSNQKLNRLIYFNDWRHQHRIGNYSMVVGVLFGAGLRRCFIIHDHL